MHSSKLCECISEQRPVNGLNEHFSELFLVSSLFLPFGLVAITTNYILSQFTI